MPDGKPPSLSAFGEVRGFFEIFLPGVFLLLHVAVLVYCTAPVNSPPADFVKWISGNLAAAASIIGLPAGYVLGLALRLGRTNFADWVSGWLVRAVPSGRKLITDAEDWWGKDQMNGEFILDKRIRREAIPYPGLMMARLARELPPEARTFYESRWINERGGGTTRVVRIGLFRFNFFKTLVASLDNRDGKEMLAAEMMVRHAAHICYALFFSALALSLSAVSAVEGLRSLLLWICGGELFLLLGLLMNLRLLRIGEVELVFACCFRNRVKLERLIQSGKLDE